MGKKPAAVYLLFGFIGLTLTLLLISLPFLLRGDFYEMISASILYNITYSVRGRQLFELFQSQFSSLVTGLKNLQGWGLAALAGYATVVFRIIQIRRKKQVDWLASATLIIFPVEIVLSGLSGRQFLHYYVCWIPAIALLLAFFADWIIEFALSEQLENLLSDRFSIPRLAFTLLFLILLGGNVLLYTHLRSVYYLIRYPEKGYQYSNAVAGYLKENTSRNEIVLVIGGQAGINVMAERGSMDGALPFPLLNSSDSGLNQQARYLNNLQTQQPEIVVDMSALLYWHLPAVDPMIRKTQVIDYPTAENTDTVLDYVWENYFLETTIDNHAIYRLKPEAQVNP